MRATVTYLLGCERWATNRRVPVSGVACSVTSHSDVLERAVPRRGTRWSDVMRYDTVYVLGMWTRKYAVVSGGW